VDGGLRIKALTPLPCTGVRSIADGHCKLFGGHGGHERKRDFQEDQWAFQKGRREYAQGTSAETERDTFPDTNPLGEARTIGSITARVPVRRLNKEK